MDRNIIICGVLDKEGSSNLWMASAIMKNGFNVIPINYRTVLTKTSQEYLKNLLVHTIETYKPSLVIFCKCNGIHPDTIKACSELTTTWLYFMDSYIITQQCPEIIEHAKNCHFSSCTSEITVEYFKEKGVKNCHHVFEGINPVIHKPVEVDNNYKADISFVGTFTKERENFYNALNDLNYDVKFYGAGWKSDVIAENAFIKVCSSSRYMLSLNSFNNIPTYFSGRVFEMLGCGSCVLHFDTTDTIAKYFDKGDLFFFKDTMELFEKIVYLNNAPEEYRQACIKGRETVLNNYTWFHSIQKMFNILSGEK